jgi:hypothetical protein
MVDVVWNDGSASGDFTSYKLRVIFLGVLAQNYFLGVGIAWLWFVLVIIQYVGFPEWQYIPFPGD